MGLALWGVNCEPKKKKEKRREFWMFTLWLMDKWFQSGVIWSLWWEVDELKEHWNCGYQVSHFIYFSIYLLYLLKPCGTFSWWWSLSWKTYRLSILLTQCSISPDPCYNCCCISLFTQSFYCFLLLSSIVFLCFYCFMLFFISSRTVKIWTELKQREWIILNYNICNNRKPRRLMLWTGLKAASEWD